MEALGVVADRRVAGGAIRASLAILGASRGAPYVQPRRAGARSRLSVRTLTRDGEPWFVLADVCLVLEIVNASQASGQLDSDERGLCETYTPGGVQKVLCVNESGLYALIVRSYKPEAKRFRKWVTAEVLPAIRRTGGYMVAAPEETPEAIMARAVLVAQDTISRQKAQLEVAQPKADALDRIATHSGSLTITEAAKALQVPPKEFVKWLLDHKWAYRRTAKSDLLARQERLGAGLMEHKVTELPRRWSNDVSIATQARVTPKGITALAKAMEAAAA